ncbi:CLUMA_CG008599, isoform A [Clunio marinus]|uniref:CLUMA_CG008599, isoform A n=1 Tax=Clunio marinus TaxID=568069 RepID=A0A1J1I9K7_9DIPT|nr:CLUMA_CG008599, isoform A [Clunio marinus]
MKFLLQSLVINNLTSSSSVVVKIFEIRSLKRTKQVHGNKNSLNLVFNDAEKILRISEPFQRKSTTQAQSQLCLWLKYLSNQKSEALQI